jgi:hypothetical protein
MSGSWDWSTWPGSRQSYRQPETKHSKTERKAIKRRHRETSTVLHHGRKLRVAPVGKYSGFG